MITPLSDNIEYKIVKTHVIDYIPPGNEKQILSGTYVGRELLSVLEGMIESTQFVNDERVIKRNKLKGITAMDLNLNELDNTNNLEDGRPSNSLLIYHVTSNEDFTCFDPHTPQYKRLKNGEFTSLTLRITDQNAGIINDGPQVTVVLHIRDSGRLYNIIPFKNGIRKTIKPRMFPANSPWNKGKQTQSNCSSQSQ